MKNAFAETINQIIEKSKKFNFDKIAAIESRGFVFASAVSYVIKKTFYNVKKKKQTSSWRSLQCQFWLRIWFSNYWGAQGFDFEKNENVLIIDDLIATGGTAEAAAKLIEISGGKVACFVFVINLFDLNGCDNLIKKGYKVENLIEFPGH